MLTNSNIISFIHTIKSEFIGNEMHFMTKQLKRVKESKPYKGFSVLQNIPFTKETLIKTEILIEGGAEVTITCPSFMDPDPALLDSFQQSGGTFTMQKDLKDNIFDFHLDCAAELLSFQPPRIGTVEITGTGTNKYRESNAEYPIISIDQSLIKNLEGILGTGEAFLRAFKEITSQDVKNKQFMIFGYGKVGRGMSHYLKSEGAKVNVVDLEDSVLEQAETAGFVTIHAKNKRAVEKAAKDMFCIATATGRENIISDNYNVTNFKDKFLANMGGDDEFGYNFKDDEVLCKKRPINFFISTPTLMRYLDPVFYAHNMGIDILLYSNLQNGLHPFPSHIAEEVVLEWTQIFNEQIFI